MSEPRQPAASLLITTYEMPRHLELVLAGLERQTTQDFEVVICDDGSGAETRRLIETFASKAPFRVAHVWQKNEGYRRCRILNEGVRNSTGRIVIFTDGDCVPHANFVRDHIEQTEEGRYLAGRRMELGPRISERLTPELVRRGYFDRPQPSLVWSCLNKDSDHLQRSLRVSSPALRRFLKMDRVVDMKGCNGSALRRDIEAVNGYDESYEGYGREDTDFEVRLQHWGLRIKSLKGLALQFHVWHPRREFTPKNDSRLAELQQSTRFRCAYGLVNDSER
jgi:glycosyltransferase involved in cell wall biosynthesis